MGGGGHASLSSLSVRRYLASVEATVEADRSVVGVHSHVCPVILFVRIVANYLGLL